MPIIRHNAYLHLAFNLLSKASRICTKEQNFILTKPLVQQGKSMRS